MADKTQKGLKTHAHSPTSEDLWELIRSDAEGSKPAEGSDFVDLANIGCRRGQSNKKPSKLLRERNSKEVEALKKSYGLLVMISEFRDDVKETTLVAYNISLEGYDDHLDLLYDGTQNSMSILGNIYLSGKLDNE